MLPLHTPVKIEPSSTPSHFMKNALMMGSCFASNAGDILQNHRFNVLVNPLGILYNPLIMNLLIQRSIGESYYQSNELVFHEGLWHQPELHGRFSHPDKTFARHQMNTQLNILKQGIEQASMVVLTLGTAWYFVKTADNKPVGNCHKLPGTLFERKLMNHDVVVDCLKQLLQTIRENNRNNTHITLTVSPIRHLRDGLTASSRSKAILLSAVHECVEAFSNVSYFPAFELMVDELRDYRFYEEDMAHPNKQAVSYITARFLQNYYDSESSTFFNAYSNLLKQINHKPLHKETPEFIAGRNKLREQISTFGKQWNLSMHQELASLN